MSSKDETISPKEQARLSWRERQRTLREEMIMEVAHDLIIERGYNAMSMDEVAERAGVAKATLYQHFPSKEELAIRVIVRAMQHVEALIMQQDSRLPAIERVAEAFRTIMAHRIAKQRADLSGQDSAPLPVRCHPLFQAQRQRLESALVRLVEQAQAEGDIGTHLPPLLFIHVILAVARGLDYDALLTDSALTPTDLQTMVVDLLFHGPGRQTAEGQRGRGGEGEKRQ